MSAVLDSGHTVEKVPQKEIEKLAQQVKLYEYGAVRIQPDGWFFMANYAKHANSIYNFRVRSTDVHVITFPKSGTNWIQEIVWNLVYNPDLDNPAAALTLDARCPFYEIDFAFEWPEAPKIDTDSELGQRFNELCPGKNPSEGFFMNLANYTPDPRLLRNHLPFNLQNPDMFKICKVIYLARDIRDAIVSYYHFSKVHKMTSFGGTLEDMVDNYIENRMFDGPYWEHVRLAWEKRNNPNFLFMYYEDMIANTKSEVKKIDAFLGTNRTDIQIENIVHYTSFDSMKKRTLDNQPTSFGGGCLDKETENEGASFFRKGKVGSWRDDFTPEIEEKVNTWIRENLTKFGDDFKYKNMLDS